MQFHQELLKLGALVVEIDREYYYDVIALFKVHNYARDVKTKVPPLETKVVKGKHLLSARGVVMMAFAKENEVIRNVCWRLLGLEKQQTDSQMSVHPFLPMHYSSSSPDPNSFMMHSPQLEVDYVIQNPLPSPSHQSWTTAPAPAAGIDPQSIQANADDLYNLPDDFLSQLDSAGTELDYIATLDMPSSSSTPFAGSYGIFPHGQG